nr:MAG: hypothetical protein [Wufeng shrew picorna-like virus 52]
MNRPVFSAPNEFAPPSNYSITAPSNNSTTFDESGKTATGNPPPAGRPLFNYSTGTGANEFARLMGLAQAGLPSGPGGITSPIEPGPSATRSLGSRGPIQFTNSQGSNYLDLTPNGPFQKGQMADFNEMQKVQALSQDEVSPNTLPVTPQLNDENSSNFGDLALPAGTKSQGVSGIETGGDVSAGLGASPTPNVGSSSAAGPTSNAITQYLSEMQDFVDTAMNTSKNNAIAGKNSKIHEDYGKLLGLVGQVKGLPGWASEQQSENYRDYANQFLGNNLAKLNELISNESGNAATNNSGWKLMGMLPALFASLWSGNKVTEGINGFKEWNDPNQLAQNNKVGWSAGGKFNPTNDITAYTGFNDSGRGHNLLPDPRNALGDTTNFNPSSSNVDSGLDSQGNPVAGTSGTQSLVNLQSDNDDDSD